MKIRRISLYTLAACLALSAAPIAQKRVSCGPDVALNVSIWGTRSAPGGQGLVSDGLGAYRNTTKGAKLAATFQVDNCTQDFTMNLNFSTRTMWALLSGGDIKGLFFNFDRVASVPMTTNASAFDAFCAEGVVQKADGSFRRNADGSYQDNYGGCGSDEYGNFVRRGGGISLDNDERLSYRLSPFTPNGGCAADPANPSCSAAYIRVYHPDVNTWILRPELTVTDPDAGPQALAAHRLWGNGNTGLVFVGYENVPFEIVATRQ